MTSSHPPQPPSGGQQPEPGQEPPYGQQPGYGQPPYGSPPPPAGYGPPPGYGQQPPKPYTQPAGTGGGFTLDLKRLRMADYVVAGGTLVYLILGFLPWAEFSDFLGFDVDDLGLDSGITDNISGYTLSSLVGTSLFLFLLATVWALLPAFTDVRLGFPRGWITVGLSALGLLLTLFAWIESLSYAFGVVPLLALLVAVAIAGFALLSLLPELRNHPALPGALANAAQWANQPAPDYGTPAQPGPAQERPTYGQPGSPPPPPPGGAGQLPGTPSSAPAAAWPPAPPSAPGGSTTSGEGPGGTDRPTGG